MKRITIGGKEYTFKFSVRASLYNECTEAILDGYAMSGRMSASAEENDAEAMYKEIISTMANIPKKATTLFYAGLLEYHGAKGDGSVKSFNDAVDLITDYLEENTDDEGKCNKSFSDVLNEMMEIMYDDNFFALIGLDKITSRQTEDKPKKQRRKKSEVGESTSTN